MKAIERRLTRLGLAIARLHPPVRFNYLIINSGYGGTEKEIEDLIKKKLEDASISSCTGGNVWGCIGTGAMELFGDLFTVDCDGPVAGDDFTVDGATLGDWTRGSGTHSETRFYPGTDSDTFCGSNSFYGVSWMVVRQPMAPASGFMIQGAFGRRGNFELVVPAPDGGLSHWWRDNDRDRPGWNGPNHFGLADKVDDVSLIQRNYSTNSKGPGNLELVVRIGDRLDCFWLEDDLKGGWESCGTFGHGVDGNPALIQSRFGEWGNFECVAPAADGGLMHFWRINDTPNPRWEGSTAFGQPDRVDAVALVQCNFTESGAGPGTFEAVARVGGRLDGYWYPDTPNTDWRDAGSVG